MSPEWLAYYYLWSAKVKNDWFYPDANVVIVFAPE